MKLFTQLFFVALFFSLTTFGQVELDFTPKSPQFEAFSQYGEVGVNLATGVPEISVPLLEIDHYGYKIPVSLDYFPSPLKPGYNYDVIGRGWNLSLRSRVARQQHYLPDEKADFVIDNIETGNYYDLGCLSTKNFAPDIFEATLPDGSSFEFTIVDRDFTGSQPEVQIANGRPVKITWVTDFANGITSFIIIDENGIEHTFSERNVSSYRIGVNPLVTTYNEWQLSSIKLPYAEEEITFKYDNVLQYNMEDPVHRFAIESELVGSVNPCIYGVLEVREVPYEFVGIKYQMKLLTEIKFGFNSVIFNYEKDHPGGLPDGTNFYNYLSSIKQDTYNRQQLVQFERQINTVVSSAPRAQLTSLIFSDVNGTANKSRYSFSYENTNVPDSFSDDWGYAKLYSGGREGVSNLKLSLINLNGLNFSFMPKIEDAIPMQQFAGYELNKNSPTAGDPNGSHGLLSRITYPTKGYTQFEFERHRFLTTNVDDITSYFSGFFNSYIFDKTKREIREASGFRVKKISNFDLDNQLLGVKHYMYGKKVSELNALDDADVFDAWNPDNHTGVGEAVVDPNLIAFIKTTAFFYDDMRKITMGMHYNSGLEGKCTGVQGGIPVEWMLEIGATYFNELLNGRPQVVYPYVTVYEGDYKSNYPTSTVGINGKSEYVFDFYDDKEDPSRPDLGVQRFFIEPILHEGNLNYYIGQSHRYNKLLTKKDYAVKDNEYVLIRLERNTWSSCSSGTIQRTYYSPKLPPKTFSRELSSSSDKFAFIRDYLRQSIIAKYETVYDSRLSSRTITDFDDNNHSFSRNEWFTYTKGGRLTNTGTSNSRGNSITTKNFYPDSYNTDILQTMTANNLLSSLVESKTYISTRTDPISGTKIEYDEFLVGGNTIIKPSEVYQLNTVQGPDGYELRANIVNYSTGGRIQEVVGADGLHTCYVWGEDGRYVLAKIANTTFENIKPVLIGAGFSFNSPPCCMLSTVQIDALKGAFPSSFITTFTYRDGFGIASQTDPAGVTTYFEYDDFGRLKNMKDYDNKILNHAEYHYAE